MGKPLLSLTVQGGLGLPLPAAAALSQHSPTRRRDDIAAGMFTADPPNKQGLAAAYSFGPEDVEKTPGGKVWWD